MLEFFIGYEGPMEPCTEIIIDLDNTKVQVINYIERLRIMISEFERCLGKYFKQIM
jgi:hypothetical protein